MFPGDLFLIGLKNATKSLKVLQQLVLKVQLWQHFKGQEHFQIEAQKSNVTYILRNAYCVYYNSISTMNRRITSDSELPF